MKIVFIPFRLESNKYVSIIQTYLKRNEVEILSLRDLFSSVAIFREVKVIHLNWFEEVRSFKEFFEKFTKLIVLKSFGKKIIWTVHNKVPHNGKYIYLQQFIIKLLILFCDRIIVHCKSSFEIIDRVNRKCRSKVVIIPHPNYIDIYGPRYHIESVSSHPKNEKLRLLFLGSVKPYKNLELLIEVINNLKSNDLILTIAGPAMNNVYGEQIQSLSKNSRIKTRIKFLENREITELIYDSDLLVLPYDTRSSLNSGVILLACSYGRSFISPKIGTVEEFVNNDKMITYEYSDKTSHKHELRKSIIRALELKMLNGNIFTNWGEILFKEVEINNDKRMVGRSILRVYQSLVKKQ
ncbi:glycosyltransferase [Lutimonas saemankumensis]|uniref:glycosyltransferase n=1 Tax=Lutimonas saemankumensis TaxID=483016 RepID=UPI001CD53111|nr:glycosyltransferase [Lutimonas saemankumensis]MCA0931594.1 glycosyltransferase [Lutimonas saemankumensis]